MSLEEILTHTMAKVELCGTLENICNDVMKGKSTTKTVKLTREGNLLRTTYLSLYFVNVFLIIYNVL